MKPIMKKDFTSKFCEYNEKNYTALSKDFKLGRIKRLLAEYKNFYVTSDSMLAVTPLTSEELQKLNLQEIELIDGLWYLKDEIEDNNGIYNL